MSLFRVSIELDELQGARGLTEQLAELIDPAPSATSYFEIPGTRRWRVDAYFESEPEADQLIAIQALAPAGVIAVEAVPDENWVAISQAALPPVEAGRFIVHGSHDRARVGLRRNAIEIDAGEAFGTAHHSTTLGCLLAIDQLTRGRAFHRVADVGSGSGVLAIAAARALPGARVVASDFDPVAAGVAHANVRANGAGAQVTALAATGLHHAWLRGPARFDLIIANILAGPLIKLAPALARAIAPGGVVMLSGILSEQAREVLGAYAPRGFSLERRIVLSGWTTLVLKRSGRPLGPPGSLNGGAKAAHAGRGLQPHWRHQTRQARGEKSSRARTRGSSSWAMPMSLRMWSSKAASSARSAHWA